MAGRLTPNDLRGPLRVLAGPGCGKTQLLVDLYAELVADHRADRGEILVLTFSTAAAEEIARRLDERLTDSYDKDWISTFHSFCARLLRDHRPDPHRLLMSGFQEQVAMREVLREIDPRQLGRLAAVVQSPVFAQDALAFVALLKQNQVPPAEISLLAQVSGTERLQALGAIYSAYQARIQAAGLRDFRDLVTEAIGLLEARPDVLERLRRRFRYVLVDEFQDVDPAQFHLVRTLAPPEDAPGLLVVGDPDQSIYGFRGTVPGLLSDDFRSAYRPRSLSLDASHRCPPPVLEAGSRLLAATQGHPVRPLTSLRTEGSPAVQVVREATTIDEAALVAREIRRLLLVRPHLRPGDVAVLLRSTSTLSAPFEEAVRGLGLPYEVRGVGTVARNEVVRFLLAYLRALTDPRAEGALERLLGSGLSGVGHHAVGRLRRHAVEEGRDFPRVVRRLLHWLHQTDPDTYPLPWTADGERAPAPAGPSGEPPDYLEWMSEPERRALHGAVSAFYGLRRRSRQLSLHSIAYAVLLEAGVMGRLLSLPVSDEQRRQTLADLRSALAAFEELEEVWSRVRGQPPHLEDVASQLESWIGGALDETEPAPGRRDAVQIMTVHQSKGLEFEIVFLSGFARGLFPLGARAHAVLEPHDQQWLLSHLQGFRPSWPSDGAEQLAEEARLAYVGMTRARDVLYLTFADQYDQPAGPSPFLEMAVPQAPMVRHGQAGTLVTAESLLTLSEAESLLAAQVRAPSETTAGRLGALGLDLRWIGDPHSGQPFQPYLERPIDVDPGHFSPTTLNDYLRCPRVYWYNHHPGLVAAPRSVQMERGSFLHEVLERFHGREAEWRALPTDEQRAWLEAALEEHLAEYLDRIESVLDRRAEEQAVRQVLANYISFATRAGPVRRLGTVMTEKKFHLDVDGAEVRGKIDRIIDTGDGTCEVVDYKTGNGYGMDRTYKRYFGPEMYDAQLAMYYLACREGVDDDGAPLGLEPRFLSLWFPKKVVYGTIRQSLFPVGEPAPFVKDYLQHPVGDEELARGRSKVVDAIRRIHAGDFAPQPRADAEGTCLSWSGCPHTAICPFGGQRPE
jgi:DNA helicase-2/ATP-dependent DNA helicase PcrA